MVLITIVNGVYKPTLTGGPHLVFIENGQFIVDLPIKVVIFHSYGAVYQRVILFSGYHRVSM